MMATAGNRCYDHHRCHRGLHCRLPKSTEVLDSASNPPKAVPLATLARVHVGCFLLSLLSSFPSTTQALSVPLTPCSDYSCYNPSRPDFSQRLHPTRARIISSRKYDGCNTLISAASSLSFLQMSQDDEDDYDEDYDDDDEPPEVNMDDFSPNVVTLGGGGGRSAPTVRKAMGRSSSGNSKVHVCTNCGSEFVKWMGRCPTCQEWNSLEERVVERTSGGSRSSLSSKKPVFGGSGQSWLDGMLEDDNDGGYYGDTSSPVSMTRLQEEHKATRERVEIPDDEEMNQVLGGGIMAGSLVLIGGDPGVGKSTLLLQTAGSLASLAPSPPGVGMGSMEDFENSPHGPVWYVSGEESPRQVASRATRLGIHASQLLLLSETNVDILSQLVARELHKQGSFAISDSGDGGSSNDDQVATKPPALIVVDSIQTCVCGNGGNSAAGGVTQVRECVAVLLRLAKATGISIFLVGHVTKAGGVAGPKTVEHMVDTVLYLEHADSNGGSGAALDLRLLRASKNRFGSADQVGVYRMRSGRLQSVSDPSSLFLQHRNSMTDLEGSAVCVSLEGMRAVTSEVQALATAASFGQMGRKTAQGISVARLQLLVGVLQKRCRIFLFKQDVYLNVAGGGTGFHKQTHHATDLAVAVALVSSLVGIAVRSDTAFCGEIGLLGELRMVPALDKRVAEARRMGFSRIVTPREYSMPSKTGRKRQQQPQQDRLPTYTKTVAGLEWIQCEFLLDAINVGLVEPVPRRQPRKKAASKGKSKKSAIPETLEELDLPEIMDEDEGDGEEDAFL